MRIDSFSKIAVKEACKANAVDEACSPPRMQVFELPLSQEASAIAILPRPSRPQQRADTGIKAHAAEHGRSRGRWSVSPLWEGKILLGVLREKGLAGKGLVSAFEKWAPTVAGCSRADMNRVYCEQTGREMSDYVLVQQADKAVRYNQLPPEAEVVRRTVLSPDFSCLDDHIQPEQTKSLSETKGSLRWSKQRLIDEHDPNVLLSTKELASLTGFTSKTIRRWVSRRLLNHIRVGNRLRFRLATVELFLAQREVRR